jgi:hypothetical protein
MCRYYLLVRENTEMQVLVLHNKKTNVDVKCIAGPHARRVEAQGRLDCDNYWR